MLREIKDPLENIFEFEARKKSQEQVQEEFNTKLTELDVLFNNDREFIELFAKKANIPIETADRIAIAFFEEIKRNLFIGNAIVISRLGKFFINLPRKSRNKKDKTRIYLPSEHGRFKWFPRFVASSNLKKLLRKAFAPTDNPIEKQEPTTVIEEDFLDNE